MIEQQIFEMKNGATFNKIPLTLNNFRHVVNELTQPHKQNIKEASDKFKSKLHQCLQEQEGTPLATEPVLPPPQEKRISLFSDQDEETEKVKVPPPPAPPPQRITKAPQLGEWKPGRGNDLKDYKTLVKQYEEVFKERKFASRGNKSSRHDFRMEERDMLTVFFHEIKDAPDNVSFEAVVRLFQQCKLFYLCYNIKPYHLLDVIKDHAHLYRDRLTLEEFLHFFQIDRPNITFLERTGESVTASKCVLSKNSWAELKSIFTTLDTFGSEQVQMNLFLHKIKNNFTFSHLLNQPAISYPEISRTIPLKKILFTLEHRRSFKEKVVWGQIQSLITRFNYVPQPTIDQIYGRMIARGHIDMKSNYFMTNGAVLEEIKLIYHRCPKYCQYFVKTRFVVGELLESRSMKERGREEVVRVVRQGQREKKILLEQQIMELGRNAHQYIDLDELLEYFSIKGPINTASDPPKLLEQSSESDEEEHQVRLYHLSKVRSSDRLREMKKGAKGYKQVRHLTVCEEFKLSRRQKESTMERKTRQWKERQAEEEEAELQAQFKANPIPADLNQERYNAYIQKQEIQKLLRKEEWRKRKMQQNKHYQYLKSNTKLFAKKAQPQQPEQHPYRFKATPIPWFIGQMNMLQLQEQERKVARKRNLTQKKLSLHRTWNKLPGVMLYNDRDDSNSNPSHQLVKSQKDIGFKAKQVPDFEELHRKFEAQLASKKQSFVPTRPIEFNFTQHQSRKERVGKSSVNQSHVVTQKKSLPRISADRNNSVSNIPMTIKFSQMVAHNHKRYEEKEQEKERQATEERNRKAKQEIFARFMRKKLKKSLHKSVSLKDVVREKAVKLRQEWQKVRRNNEEELCNMYENVMARPFLFETQSIHKSKTAHAPLKKKSRAAYNQSRHVHESPLKAFEPQNNEESPMGGIAAHQVVMGMEWEEDQNVPSYVNQSF